MTTDVTEHVSQALLNRVLLPLKIEAGSLNYAPERGNRKYVTSVSFSAT